MLLCVENFSIVFLAVWGTEAESLQQANVQVTGM